ncbi:GCN5 family acetyltransferase [Parafrankia colletiae]|uniref:GCN5 family acetyltransferase n=1 Tax=Parafrankia colletiae TaxID=573497 RepID=A0A1S1RNT4_9ACTN|nr:GNAT family N-acetyltransferase [Parafrankia colletiae]MCK9901184.1 GNAT family N-acetyltransferase [Frankia sp. Cpl3]OHV46454.1 GCN5 family acetyltransferase [Parafrankia colletiae]
MTTSITGTSPGGGPTSARQRTQFEVTGTPDLDAVTRTLTLAFAADPILDWAIPRGSAERDRWLAGFFRTVTGMLLDHRGLVGSTPGYSALTVWSPPGEPALDDAEQARFDERLAAACGPHGDRAVALMRALDEHYPTDLPPHFHVMFSATRPEPGASGSAVLLVHTLLRTEHLGGHGIYAEASTPQNRDLWQGMGMRPIGDEITLPDGGPSLYPLWRDASAPRA